VDIEAMLAQTLEDRRLSRAEGQALREVLRGLSPDRRKIAEIRTRAFEAARAAATGQENGELLDWLEEIMRILFSVAHEGRQASHCEAAFSPGPDCVGRIRGLFRGARQNVDAAVYTLTDDRIASAILAAHSRGVEVRLIADDEKVGDRGSDLARLSKAGVSVVTDSEESHMHHKFALFDDSLVLTGSYNWTRSAAEENQENIVISDDARLLGAFREEFDRLWNRFSR
jgi:cardiolipin hydrolase